MSSRLFVVCCLLFVVCCLLFVGQTCWAATKWVSPAGSGDGSTIDVPANIEALSYSAGDTINMLTGTYAMSASNLTITKSSTWVAYDGAVIIDGGATYGFVVAGGAGGTTTAFTGTAANTITIQNSAAAGLNVTPSGGDVTFNGTYVVFLDNAANGFQITPHVGGNVIVTLTNCTSSLNTSDAYSIITANRNTNVTLNLTNCIAFNNNSDASGTDQHFTSHANTGTGVDTVTITGGSYTGDNCEIINIGGNTTMTVTGATLQGLQIKVNQAANLFIDNTNTITTVSGTSAFSASSHTGYVFIDGQTLIGKGGTTFCGFRNQSGTGTYVFRDCTIGTSTGGGRGIYNETAGVINLEGCTIVSTGAYAAIDNVTTGTVRANGCSFPNSYAQTDAKVICTDGNIELSYCVFSGGMNAATDEFVRIANGCDLATIDHCTFYNIEGGASVISLGTSPNFIIRNSIFHTISGYAITLATAGSYTANKANGYNCFWAVSGATILSSGESLNLTDLNGTDPKLVDAANGDFRLLPSSPCLNTGTVTPNGGYTSIGAWQPENMDNSLASGDFDDSGLVDFNDFSIFASNWLKSTESNLRD